MFVVNYEEYLPLTETIYLVQEYLNCETLEERLKIKDGIDSSKTSIALTMMTSEVIRLILGILEGLELLQSYGVNILYRRYPISTTFERLCL